MIQPTQNAYELNHAFCRKLSLCDKVTASYSFTATILRDACHLSPNDSSFPSIDSLPWKRIISPLHLPCLQNEISRMSFCVSMTHKNNLIYLLSKTINKRCMTRMFQDVCISVFQNDEECANIVKMMLLISFLGNYRHSTPSSRISDIRVRLELYQRLWHERGKWKDWFMELVYRAPYMVEFCLRDYLVFHIHDNPSLAKHLSMLFNLDHFCRIVEKATSFIRKILELNLFLHLDVAHLGVQLQTQLKPFHEALLKVSYRVPKTTDEVISYLVSLRLKQVPLNIQEVKKEVQIQEEEDDLAMADKASLILDVLAQKEPANSLIEEEEEVSVDYKALEAAHEGKLSIKPKTLRELSDLVQKIAPTRRDAFLFLISLFPQLGASTTNTNTLHQLMIDFILGGLVADHIPNALLTLRCNEPLIYELLQITVDLMKYHTRIVLVRTLPPHMLEAQIRVLQEGSFRNLKGTNHALYDACDLVICSTCSTACSMVSDFSSAYRKTFRSADTRQNDTQMKYNQDYFYSCLLHHIG